MPFPHPRRSLAAVTVAVTLLLTAGCASPQEGESPNGGQIPVVASTNVWGDVAAQVGGDLVHVTALMSDPNADPHSFEASAQAQLAVSKASLVVRNGGGYDDFVDTMLSSVQPRPDVFYDFPTVAKVADAIAAELSTLAPAHADAFAANVKAFDAKVTDLQSRTATLRTSVAGKGVAITEPVPGYLLDALGLVDRTPAAFSAAIENETDVPATVLAELLRLFSSHQVDALVYNEQTTGPQTAQVLAAAKAASVAVVPVTETLPAGKDFVTWMNANLDALATALHA